ncbi:MAG: hypothetical protein J7L88_00250, partial [Thermoplasmata archaeon]|nr:hypothetical protein [Thermoplasmata archaeon]
MKANGFLYIISLTILLSTWTQVVGTAGEGVDNLRRAIGDVSVSGRWESLTISPNLTYPYYHIDGGEVYYS